MHIVLYADGGTTGRNPAPAVYWSVAAQLRPDRAAKIVVRGTAEDYHTNNDAEWLALSAALGWAARTHAGAELLIFMDSKYVVNQFHRKWRVKIARHHRLYSQCNQLAEKFAVVDLQWRPREHLVRQLGH